MSVNHNRAKFNKAEDGRTYRLLKLREMYPPYWDGDYNWKYGDFPNHVARSYKTWKHTRKTQWK